MKDLSKTLEELPAFAIHWAKELGSNPSNLKRLHGGINNRVYLCSTENQKWVIKGYPPREPDQRDRMRSEVQFLQLANEVAQDLAPCLIHADDDNQCVVLEHLEGKSFQEGIPPDADSVAAAARFIQLLNRDAQLARKWVKMDASEGFLSLREHIANVNERLELMSCDHLEGPTKPQADSLVNQIRNEIERVQECTINLINQGDIPDCIDRSDRCVSPSDFGFHNAVMTHKGVRFIDFEFAGWDDPAKMSLDFILQPRVPIIELGFPLNIAWNPALVHSIKSRCQDLAPILRLKWACIILSVLNPKRLKELVAIQSENTPSVLVQERIDRAKLYLHKTRYTLEHMANLL